MARAVYVVRYPTLLEWTSHPQADQASERLRVCGTKGGERGGNERLVPVDYTARPSHCFFLNVLNPGMHADILPHCSAQPHAVGLGQTLQHVWTGCYWQHASTAGHSICYQMTGSD